MVDDDEYNAFNFFNSIAPKRVSIPNRISKSLVFSCHFAPTFPNLLIFTMHLPVLPLGSAKILCSKRDKKHTSWCRWGRKGDINGSFCYVDIHIINFNPIKLLLWSAKNTHETTTGTPFFRENTPFKSQVHARRQPLAQPPHLIHLIQSKTEDTALPPCVLAMPLSVIRQWPAAQSSKEAKQPCQDQHQGLSLGKTSPQGQQYMT